MRLAMLLCKRLLFLFLMPVVLAQALPARGQDAELVEVGSMPYGPCYAATLNSSAEVAFLGNGSVLQALELTYPYEPKLVGELRLPGAIHAMFYGDDKLYVANGHGGLRIIGMKYTVAGTGLVTKVEFTEIGALESLTDARHLDVWDNKAYVANGRHGLAVVDVSEPAQPVLLGSYRMPGEARGEALEVAVHPGDSVNGGLPTRAYVAAGASGLHIVDVENPAGMQPVTHSFKASDVSSVAVVGNLLYILDREEGLCAVTGINTDHPVEQVPYFDTGGDKVSVTVHNSSTLNQIAFVADGASGVCIVDVATPGSFEMKAGGFIGGGDHLNTPGFATRVYATPGTDTVLVADDNGGLRVLGKAGSVEGLWEMSQHDTPGLARAIAISGDVAYIADGDGVRVYDISSPLAFPELGMVALTRDFQGIAASGNYAYVTAPDGLHLVNATKPSAITTTPIFDMGIPARKVAVLDGVLSLTSSNARGGVTLCVLNVLTPTQPKVLAAPTNMPAGVGLGVGVAMDKKLTYLAGDDGLYVLDRNNYSAGLRWVGGLADSSRVAISGDYAYLTDADGLGILSVPNAVGGIEPREVGRLNNSVVGSLTTVAVAGKDVYAVGDNELHVIDATNINNPQDIGTLTLPLDREGDVLATSGNRVYAIAGAAGVRIYGVDRDPPVANAGADISIFSGFSVFLRADASTDDVAIVKYDWKCLDPNIELNAADTDEARFIAPQVSQPTRYEFELTVEDKAGRSDTDTMVVTVNPYPKRDKSSSASSGCSLNPEAGFSAEWLLLAALLVALRVRRGQR